MKRVIVTGASGFIGQALTKRLLREGCQVWALVRNPAALPEQDGLTVVTADFEAYPRLPELIAERDFDAFYHLAWNGFLGESLRDYHRHLNNAAYAADALIAAANLRCGRFILAGTIVEIEVRQYIGTDDCKPRISCLYGTAKEAAAMLCKILGFQRDIPWNLAILTSVYGPGDKSRMVQNVLISALLKGESPKLVDGKHLYDWVYVDDAAAALYSIGASGAPNRTYYVGHRNLQTFESLVTQTRDVVAPDVALRFGELKDQSEIDYSLLDRDALYRDTGFECQADFGESIRNTAQWLKSQGGL